VILILPNIFSFMDQRKKYLAFNYSRFKNFVILNNPPFLFIEMIVS